MIYGVFKVQGQVVWKNLNTTDRERAREFLVEEMRKSQKVNLKVSHKIKLDELLCFYDTTLKNFAPGTSENRRCLIKTFRNSWRHGLDMKVADRHTERFYPSGRTAWPRAYANAWPNAHP